MPTGAASSIAPWRIWKSPTKRTTSGRAATAAPRTRRRPAGEPRATRHRVAGAPERRLDSARQRRHQRQRGQRPRHPRPGRREEALQVEAPGVHVGHEGERRRGPAPAAPASPTARRPRGGRAGVSRRGPRGPASPCGAHGGRLPRRSGRLIHVHPVERRAGLGLRTASSHASRTMSPTKRSQRSRAAAGGTRAAGSSPPRARRRGAAPRPAPARARRSRPPAGARARPRPSRRGPARPRPPRPTSGRGLRHLRDEAMVEAQRGRVGRGLLGRRPVAVERPGAHPVAAVEVVLPHARASPTAPRATA